MRLFLHMLLAIVSLAVGFAQTNTIQLRNGANTTTLIAPSGGNYTLTLPAGAGTNGQVLSTNGSGTLSWTTVSGGATSIDGLSDAKSGGTNFTGSLMLGQEPASLGVNALQNTAVGIGALSSLTTGDNNVAVGYNALGSGSTSIETVAIGYNALSAGSGAGRVVAIGPEAASSCASCNYSVFIGRRAGAATDAVSDNTVVGNDAFRLNTTGAENTSIGANSLEQIVGGQNTAIGRFAGVNVTSGDGNIFIGYGSGPISTSAVSNTLYIHNNSSSTPLVKGDFAANTLTFNGSTTTTGSARVGQLKRSYRVITGATNNVQDTDCWVVVNRSAGTTTITLPMASSNQDRELMFTNAQAQTVISFENNVLQSDYATVSDAILPGVVGAWATLVSNGVWWVIVQQGQ